MYQVMEFWRTCHTLFDIDVPSRVTITTLAMYEEVAADHWISVPESGKSNLAYQFMNEMVKINIVLRHESTDREEML